jgi:hypothetical protein
MKKLNTKEFIIKANLKHDNKYNYSKSIYSTGKDKIIIICPLHGEFEQIANTHLCRSGCFHCGINKNTLNQSSNINDFINKANIIHSFKYDYSRFNYEHNKIKSIIICREHGEFTITPNNHISAKQGCPKCGKNSSVLNRKNTKEEFIKKAEKIHINKYDYSEVIYKSLKKKVLIVCKEHGTFKQEPGNHINGMGCPKCAFINAKRIRFEDFYKHIDNCIKLHNNYYDYSKFIFTKYNDKSIIICPNHGEFLCSLNAHLQCNGCPKCNRSKGELKTIKWLTENNINFEEQKKFEECKYKNVLPFDFYIPKFDLLIEYQGIQHFKVIPYFKKSDLIERQLIDKIKKDYAEIKHNFLEITYKDNINEKLQYYFEKYKHLLK